MKNWNPVETAPKDEVVLCVVGTKSSGPQFVVLAQLLEDTEWPSNKKVLRWMENDRDGTLVETDGFKVLGWQPVPELV